MGKRLARAPLSFNRAATANCVYNGLARLDDLFGDVVPSLTIVVPAFNEAVRLSAKTVLLNHAVQSSVFDQASTELIVVDDGSTDGTARLAEELLAPSFDRLRILRLDKNSGKGAAIRAGVAAAQAPIVAFMDVDMSVDPKQVPQLVEAIEHADVVVGSRSLPDSVVEAFRIRRKYMGRAFSRLVNSLTDVAIRDTQCGFKAYRTPNARMLFHFMTTNGFAFDVEVLYLARRLGMDIGEVPVVWRESGGSTVRLSDPTTMALEVFRMRLRRNWPPIPALEIASSPRRDERSRHGIPAGVFEALEPNLPILRMKDGRSLILFPLSEPHALRDATVRLGQLVPSASVVHRTVELGDLIKSAPLTLLAADGDEVSVENVAFVEDSTSTRYPEHTAAPFLD